MIAGSGYESTFLWFGVGQGVIVFVLSFALRAPRAGEVPASARVLQSARSYTPLEMVASPIFWVMYIMFVLVGAGGLTATPQLAPMANDFAVAKVPVSLGGLSSVGCRTTSAARTPCSSRSPKRSASMR